jgi:hypothetical protein
VHRLWLQASSPSAPRTAPYIRRSRDQHVVGRATRIASSNTTRARTPSGREELSTTARDQSIWSGACEPVQQRKVHQIPNAPRCQSRRRRQHVIPDPHPSSGGSICQGMPLRRTKTMPVRHARSETRGRPPCGRRGRIGKKGSTRSHNRSGSNATAIRRSRYFADEDQVREVLARLLNAG